MLFSASKDKFDESIAIVSLETLCIRQVIPVEYRTRILGTDDEKSQIKPPST
jgi:hypothetical protein